MSRLWDDLESDRRTSARIARDSLADRQPVSHTHDCETSTHRAYRIGGARFLRCCDCGLLSEWPAPPVKGGQGTTDDEIRARAWQLVALVAVAVLVAAVWVLL